MTPTLDSLPARPLRAGELAGIREAAGYDAVEGAVWACVETEAHGWHHAALDVVIVATGWVAALELGVDGWEVVYRADREPGEDVEQLRTTATARLGRA